MKIWLRYTTVILSMLALIVSLGAFITAYNRDMHRGIDYLGVFSIAMTVLVTILVCWQISSIVNLQNLQRKWEDAISGIDEKVIKQKEYMSCEMIRLTTIISAYSFNGIYRKVFTWLNVIEQDKEDGYQHVSTSVAVVYIANEFNKLAESHANGKLDIKQYKYLWSRESFEYFYKIAIKNNYLSEGANLIVNETLQKIADKKYQ